MSSHQILVERASKARERAHAPYSNFRVGAALLTQDGQIFEGCNVENASFGLTICAERVAITNAVSQGYKKFKAMAIITDSEPAASPCGACRQVMAEFAPDLLVILVNTHGSSEETNLGELLPKQFKFR